MARDDLDVKGLSLADLVAALKQATGNDDEAMRKKAQYEAEAWARLEKTENETHPGISVYSWPEGDVARPKAPLKSPMVWVGYDLHLDTLTPEEVRLLNLAEPGAFLFTKTDGARETLTVEAERGPSGSISKLNFFFPCRGENKHNLPSMTAILRETQGRPSREAELLAEIAALRAESASALHG